MGEQSFGRKQQGVETQSIFFTFALDLNRFKGVLGRIPDWLPSIFAEEVQSSDEGAYYCAGKKAHDRLADIVSKEGHVIAVKTRGGEITVRYKVGILSKQDKETK